MSISKQKGGGGKTTTMSPGAAAGQGMSFAYKLDFLLKGTELIVADPKGSTEWKCSVCGCTDDHACPGGCYWVEPGLCSRCIKQRKSKEEKQHD